MHYEDPDRRVSLWGGLVLGAVVGTGLALLVPTERLHPRRRRKPLREGWDGATSRLGAAREQTFAAAQDLWSSGRDRMER